LLYAAGNNKLSDHASRRHNFSGEHMTDSTVESLQPPGVEWVAIDGGSDPEMWTIGGIYVAAATLFTANAS
jgi:hypothetical protein